ncbi:P2X purinoceptor 3 isoform 3-T3 [Morphnus guianensis]
MPPPRPGTRWVTDFFSYETTKSVVVKSWVVGAVNRGVQLLILAYFIGWVFLHEKAYQVRDTVIESSVVTKVKGIGRYAGRVLDTADYVTPHQGTSVFVVVTKQILTENQAQGVCPESEAEYRCTADRDCQGKSPTTGSGVLTGRCVPYNGTLRTCEIQGWCPPEVDTVDVPVMLEAENFTLFIKNSIRFPLFGFEKANLPPPGSGGELGRCRFHPEQQPLCPILRLGDVVRLAGQDFPTLASTGGVLGIKIGWVCDLDRAWERCLPRYSFTRLDGLARPPAPAPGYNFRHARYYRWPDGTERRTLTKAFGIRFDVLVYGNAGKFGIVPTLINTVAAFTSIGVGTVLCDIILLNFLKGAEHYKARKFEEVSRGAGATVGLGPERGHLGVGAGSSHTGRCVGLARGDVQAVPLSPPSCPGYGAATNLGPIPCPTGTRSWRACAPHQPHGVSPRGAGGLQSRQAVHRLGHVLPRPLALGAMGQPPTCPPLWGSPLPAPGRGAPAPSPPQPPQWLAHPFPHWQWDRAQGAYGAVGDAGARGAGGAVGTTSGLRWWQQEHRGQGTGWHWGRRRDSGGTGWLRGEDGGEEHRVSPGVAEGHGGCGGVARGMWGEWGGPRGGRGAQGSRDVPQGLPRWAPGLGCLGSGDGGHSPLGAALLTPHTP